ncbi:aconitate hydratase, partial [Candidatus Woesearchaeota archaeon CG_4_10_14_0_2_um_filter_57_5]
AERQAATRKLLGRPLTLTEKIVYAHLAGASHEAQEYKRGSNYVELNPDRVAMQDATAQMAVLQFMTAGKSKSAVPASIHCDHLIQARQGADNDLAAAELENNEVYAFLRSAARRYGMDFWKPGAGIIHQVVLENFAFPGGLLIGTDSHTPNAGGLGMLAIGVGGADAVDAMAGLPWEVPMPTVYGIVLKGSLRGWASPKDIILKLAGMISVKGGTGAVLEYIGGDLSCTGKATVCNMGAEVGATCSVFGYDTAMADYLHATGRGELAALCDANKESLQADPEVLADPSRYYDKVITINLDTLQPYLNGPFTPDRATPAADMHRVAQQEGWPTRISACLIGSCTNSSYEDIERCASIAKAAIAQGLRASVPFYVTPGSETIRQTIERDGQLAILKDFGATVLANACGPCIGMWKREVKEKNTIVTSFNRNFAKRNDGSALTHAFVASPELVTALAITGELGFNPLTDRINGALLSAPIGDALPAKGFSGAQMVEQTHEPDTPVIVSANSKRLALLEPFPTGDDKDLHLRLLMKTAGKCTTDHISMAGPWLALRGHLDKISENMFLGATNAITGETGKVSIGNSASLPVTPARAARELQKAGISWFIAAEENYGEGSSREHAAMEPRHLGCRAIVCKSFARIHETNLKKQGVLPLTFVEPKDYDLLAHGDELLIPATAIAVGKDVRATLTHTDGSTDPLTLRHTLNEQQLRWFIAGSALNVIRQRTEENNKPAENKDLIIDDPSLET